MNLIGKIKYIFILLVFSISLILPFSVNADTWVNGYYRSNGTYISGHYRSSPDGNPYNNWSYPGNTNPYTGVTATGNPSTYLKNYYDNSSSYSYTPSYTYTPTINYTKPINYSYPTNYSNYSSLLINKCPTNSYYNYLSDSCKCSYGYISNGDKCILIDQFCRDEYGINTSYSLLDKECKCDNGYVFDSDNSECITLDNYCKKFDSSYYYNYIDETCNQYKPSVLGLSTENQIVKNSLVKSNRYAEVFYVDQDLCLHWIVNEVAALKHFGASWNNEGNIKELPKIPSGYKFCSSLK